MLLLWDFTEHRIFMSASENTAPLLSGDDICTKLLQSAIDTQTNLIVVMHNNTPLLFNKAFQNFTNMPSVKMFLREFGSLLNRFVPHDAYFHAGKTDPENWVSTLQAIPDAERIVSMVSCRAEPFAFSVTIDTPVDDFAIISFVDISQDLIKRIMIENDVSIDKESGAFNKDYFIHTAKSFQNAALFNEKLIGISMIKIDSFSDCSKKNIRDLSSSIKSNIRQSDMLVRWDESIFLLAYLIDSAENAMRFSHKLLNVMREEPFECLKSIGMRCGTSVQVRFEEIDDIIARAEKALKQSSDESPAMLL